MEGGPLKRMMFEHSTQHVFEIQIHTAIASSLKSTPKCVQRMASELKYTHLGVNNYTHVFFLLHAFTLRNSYYYYLLLAFDARVRCCSTRERYCKFYLSFLYQVTFYRKDPILMNGAGEIKSFHILSWFYL